MKKWTIFLFVMCILSTVFTVIYVPIVAPVEVSSISLNYSSRTLDVGDYLSLNAYINPTNATNNTITWSSSNSYVASVYEGRVTARNVGNATITAKSSNGKSASCYITVKIKTGTTYSITYNLNGGTNNSSNTNYYYYGYQTTLYSPTREGYTFKGWTGSNGSTPQTNVTIKSNEYGNKSYTANWTPISYNLTYNLDGGYVNYSNKSSYTIETSSFTLYNPSKNGATFTGWTGSNGSTPQTSVTIAKGSTGDKSYTANWSYTNYSISYNLSGGTLSSSNLTSYNANTNTFILNNPTRDGCIFTGWTGSNGSTPQTSVTIAKGSTGDKEYTANWELATYTISYNLNGGEVDGTNPITYTINSNSIEIINPTKDEYIFTGWTGSNGSTPQTSVTIAKGSTGNKEYTANWLAIDYDIIYNLNGGINNQSNPIKFNIESEQITLFEPSRDGYTFTGWTGSNGSTPQTNVIIAKGSTGNKEYTANWKANTYTLTFNTNGGSEINSITQECDTLLQIPKPTLYGKSFAGWYDSYLTKEINLEKMPTKNMTVYAKWIDYSIEISYDRDSEISGLSPLSIESFGLIAKDTDGNNLDVIIELLDGVFEVGNTITVRAKASGLYSMSKSKLFNSVKVYGMPTLNYDINKNSINISDELTPSLFSLSGKDTFNGDTILSLKILTENYEAGDYASIELKSEDIVGNIKTIILDNIKIYGKPNISYNSEIKGIKDTDVITSELFEIVAKDSFNKQLTCSTSIYSGLQKAGNVIKIKSSAIDEFGNYNELIFDVKVYGNPSISEALINQFKLSNDISIEKLGVIAFDSFGTELSDVKINLESDEKVSGVILTYNIIATDSVGNIGTKKINVKFYDEPTISYDLDKLLIKEDDVINPELFNAKAIDSFGNALSVNAIIKHGEQIGGKTVSIEFSTTDCVGNEVVVLVENIRVYSEKDIQLTFNKALTDKVSVKSNGKEFNATAKDSFNEPCSISILSENLSNPISGTISNIYLVAKDVAGNVVKSELINNIKIYDLPVITFLRDRNYCYETNDSLYSLFIAKDSFGEELDYELTITGERKVGNTITVSIKSNDILNNCSILNIELLVIGTDQVAVKLINDFNTKESYYSVNINSTFNFGVANTNLLETNFLGWYSETGIAFTDATGQGLDVWKSNNPKVLYAMFDCFNISNQNLIGISNSLKNYHGNIVIPNGVISIQNNVFADCDKLTGIIIPNSVTSIGSNAFKNCSSLINISIPNSVTSIGSDAFYGCSSLQEMTLPFVGGSIKTANDTYQYPFGYIFGTSFYIGSYEVKQSYYGEKTSSTTNKTYYIPEKLTKVMITGGNILYGAFNNCSNLISITIPNSATSIGSCAFDGCTGLTSIVIPNGVTSISYQAFYNCSSLTSVTIGNSVTSISGYAFYNCRGLKEVHIDSIESWCKIKFDDGYIESYVANPLYYTQCLYLDNELVTELVIPNSVTSISVYAFYGCTSLTSVTIPNSVTSIGSYAFYGCSNLTSVTIGNSVTSIGSYAFYNCNGLKEVHINSIESWCKINFRNETANPLSYAHYLYLNNDLVTELVIPNDVRSIKSYAFYSCFNLTNITLPNSIISIDTDAFRGCNKLIEVINLSKLSIECGKTDNGYVGCYAKRISSSTDTALVNSNGIIYFVNETEKIAIALVDNSATMIILDEDCTSIYLRAFENCNNLTSIIIPESVRSIGYSAFSGCTGLTSITIPNSVTSIGSGAFSGCSSLEEITIPFVGENKNATKASSSTLFGYIFGSNSYMGSTSVKQNYSSSDDYYIYYIPKSLTKVTITGGNILYGAFYNCTNLTSITIPNSVTSIGSSAFYNCNGLKEVHINSIESWCKISFGSTSANPLSYAHCLYLDNELVTQLVIPNSVTSIGDYAFYGCTSLTSIVIPNSVTSIGHDAFYNCYRLVEVTNLSKLSIKCGATINGFVGYYAKRITSSTDTALINSNGIIYFVNETEKIAIGLVDYSSTIIILDEDCTSIKSYAFYNCSKLTNITIPNSVTSIGDYAFFDCTSLTSVTIGNGVTSIGERAFEDCKNLTSITIGNSVTSIGSDAFSGCSKLTNITIPNSVTSIGSDAFYGCSNLTSVTIGNGVTYIGDYAFEDCSSLINISIPNSVTSIGYKVFYNCSSLTSVTIGNGVTSIGSYAFSGCSKLTNITIPNSVTSIGSGAFSGCSKLTNITIPNSVTSIDSYAFYGCSNLTSVTIPNSVTSIGSNTFYGCSNLKRIIISNNVTIIGDYAFYGCTSLTSIVIPESVTSIGYEAFYNCSSLSSMTFKNPNNWQKASNYTFTRNVTSNITLLDPVQNATWFKNTNGYYNYYWINPVSVDDDNFSWNNMTKSLTVKTISGMNAINVYKNILENIIIIDGLSYKIPSEWLTGCLNIKTIYIGDGVTSIDSSAFYKCSSLINISIPNSVTSIGSYAFYGCSNLKSVTIPDSVTSIGWDAFYDCTSLTSIVIPESVTSMGDYVFYGCTSLKSVTIGNGVTSIGSMAFFDCTSLTSVTIGNGVTSIGERAFEDCKNLTSIIIPNSVTSIGTDAFYSCSNLIIYCELTSRPSSWSSSWNCNRNFYWYSETQPINSGIYWHYDIDGVTPIIW